MVSYPCTRVKRVIVGSCRVLTAAADPQVGHSPDHLRTSAAASKNMLSPDGPGDNQLLTPTHACGHVEGETPLLESCRNHPMVNDAAADIEEPELLLGWRRAFALCVPLLMIGITAVIEKFTILPTQPPQDSNSGVGVLASQRMQNLMLLNRSCAHVSPVLSSGAAASIPYGSNANPQVVIGAGFTATGLSSLSTTMMRLPGACTPPRVSPGFWTSLGSAAGHPAAGRGVVAEEEDEGDHELRSPTWRLPSERVTRERYLRSVR